mmetsp:Transcript_63487/g.112914  ORF Transcript_63487/g.112914 Transcript_63487/m.112914 type:complete len:215 (+) Transcript_63487:103-747(+)
MVARADSAASRGYMQQFEAPAYVPLAPCVGILAMAEPMKVTSSLTAPPGLSLSEASEVGTCHKPRRICFFQNRYHHATGDESYTPCSRGDNCEFCHCFHPRIKRRNDPSLNFCSCNSTSDDSCSLQSTTLDDSCSLSSASEDSMPSVPSPVAARPTKERLICYFQNRHYHTKNGEKFSPCVKGRDCDCCHEFHPRILRRNDKHSRCNCPVKADL